MVLANPEVILFSVPTILATKDLSGFEMLSKADLEAHSCRLDVAHGLLQSWKPLGRVKTHKTHEANRAAMSPATINRQTYKRNKIYVQKPQAQAASPQSTGFNRDPKPQHNLITVSDAI